MIEFSNVYLKYIKNFFTLYAFNAKIEKNTLFLGEPEDGTYAIMRLISKLEKCYSGKIYIDGKNIKTIKDKDLPVAYVTRDFALFENKTVFYNLYYPLKIRKINKNVAKEQIVQTIKKYNDLFCDKNEEKIVEFLNKKTKELTNIQKQFICLIRAILRKPKYLLIEDFFEKQNNNSNSLKFGEKILNDAKEFSTIIACEKSDELEFFNNFNKIKLLK